MRCLRHITRRISIAAALTARSGGHFRARVLGAMTGLCLLLFPALTSSGQATTLVQDGTRPTVDLELVLAVDVSRSMDPEEQLLQQAGYIAAFRNPEVIDAIQGGPLGRIAVTYFEWAGSGLVREVVPWTVVDGPQSAEAVALMLAAAEPGRLSRTSISGALTEALRQFDRSPYSSPRRVIDVSGDGPNNQGEPVEWTRDRVLERGIVINGLPVMLRPSYSGFFDISELDIYYEDCVIGGFGAFIVPVQNPDEFATAIRRKLVLEIAGRTPVAAPRIVPVQSGGPLAKMDCLIGERLWNQWFNSME